MDTSGSERMREFLSQVAVGPAGSRDLNEEQAMEAMGLCLSRTATDVQIGVFLIAQRMKRETTDENLGFYRALVDASTVVSAGCDRVISLCDPYDGFNRVPHYAPVVAATLGALGYPCLLHSSRSMPPKNGLTVRTVLSDMGMALDIGGGEESVHRAAERLTNESIAYVDLEDFCPSLAALSTIRAEIAKRPFLATLEKLIVPLRGRNETHVIAGWVHSGYEELMMDILGRNGFASSLLFKGREGHTDPHPHRETVFVSRVAMGRVESGAVDPSALEQAPLEEDGAVVTADAIGKKWREVMAGLDTAGSRTVRLSVGTILHHLGLVDDVKTGIAVATQTLQAGETSRVFDTLHCARS